MKHFLSSRDKKYGTFLFLIWPLLSLLILSKYYKTRFYSNVIWALFGFLGLFLIYNAPGSDAFRYGEMFEEFAKMNTDEKRHYFGEGQSLDYFRPFSFYFISIFTTDSRLYFVCIALFFGFFYKKMLYDFFNKLTALKRLPQIIVFTSFIFILPFLSFKFVRFSTATIIFLYFTIKYFDTNNVKYQLFAAGSILVHFALVLPVGFLLIYRFLPKTKIYFPLFVITSFITFIEFEQLKSIIQLSIPTNILEVKSSYLNEDYKEAVEQSFTRTNWYIQYRGLILKISSLFILLIAFSQNNFKNIINYNLLIFGFAFGIIANIVAVVPSGFRFLGISGPLIWYVIICNYINDTLSSIKHKKIISLIIIPVSLFNVVIGFRYFADDMPIDVFFSNFVWGLVSSSEIPIINLIKGG